MESPEQTIRRLQRELRQKDTAIRQRDAAIAGPDSTAGPLHGILKDRDVLWEVTARQDRQGADAALMAWQGGSPRDIARPGQACRGHLV